MATEPLPTPKPTPRRSEQDRQMADFITGSQELITARDDAESPRSCAKGHTAEKLAEGWPYKPPRKPPTPPANSHGGAIPCTWPPRRAETTARASTPIPRIASAYSPTPPTAPAVGLKGAVPETSSNSSPPPAPPTKTRSKSRIKSASHVRLPTGHELDAALATLDGNDSRHRAQAAAVGAATRATAARNAAVQELKTWMRMFRKSSDRRAQKAARPAQKGCLKT